jgi:hypothetical protein
MDKCKELFCLLVSIWTRIVNSGSAGKCDNTQQFDVMVMCESGFHASWYPQGH